MSKAIQIRCLLLAKDRKSLIVTNAIENHLVQGTIYSQKKPHGEFGVAVLEDYEEIPWDIISNLDQILENAGMDK